MWRPEPTEAGEPFVDVAQRLPVDGVKPTLAVGPHGGEAVVAQDLQVLGYCGLADIELVLDGRADDACRQFACCQQFENAPSDRITQYVESVHHPKLKAVAYISQALSTAGSAGRQVSRGGLHDVLARLLAGGLPGHRG